MSITTTKQFIDFLFLLSKFNFSKNKPRTFFRFLAYSSVYTVLSAFNFFTSSRESPEILAISSRAYFPAASIRSATSFKESPPDGSTTSSAGGLDKPFQGIVAFPPKGGLTNLSTCYWWPLKSGILLLLPGISLHSIPLILFGNIFFIVYSFTFPNVSQ